MLNKFNITALNKYSDDFAKKTCNDFFANNAIATGNDLLDFTPIKQINLFIVSDLYEKWKVEMEGIKSSYFNFASEEVKRAMQNFMSVVSQNIAVRRADLEPVVASSTKSALMLLIEPKEYFAEVFRSQPDFRVTSEAVKQLRKYVRWNNFVPQVLAEHMGERSFVYVNNAIDWTNEAFENTNAEPRDKWLRAFSVVEPLDIKTIHKAFDQDDAKTEEVPKMVAPIPTPEPKIEVNLPVEQPLEATTGSEPTSLNDSLRTDHKTVADSFRRQPLANIEHSIPLNQKFTFIYELFAGSNTAYEVAIAELESASTLNAAMGMIEHKIAVQNAWNIDSSTVKDLITIVQRRFG